MPLPANRKSQEVSRYSQRCVLNQLVGSPGTCSRVWPPMHIISVPFHARKVLEASPTRAGCVTRRRQTGHLCRWSSKIQRMPNKLSTNDEMSWIYCDVVGSNPVFQYARSSEIGRTSCRERV